MWFNAVRFSSPLNSLGCSLCVAVAAAAGAVIVQPFFATNM